MLERVLAKKSKFTFFSNLTIGDDDDGDVGVGVDVDVDAANADDV